MMQDGTLRAPIEVVIWVASLLIAALLGVGAAYVLWSGLHHTAEAGVLTASVAALGFGLALVGLALQTPRMRAALVLFAVMLLLAFYAGSPAFAHLMPVPVPIAVLSR